MSKQQTPSIPYLPVLEMIDTSSNEIVLEEHGLRLPIMTNNWRDKFPYTPLTSLSLGYTDAALYARFVSVGKGLRAQHLQDGSKVHEDSCVELFIQKPTDPERYFNFEFNCIGVCDAALRTDRANSTPFTKREYQQIARASCLPYEQIDRQYGSYLFWVSVRIPFALMGISPEAPLPTELRMNAYKCGDKTSLPHFASWQPIKSSQPDFHRPDSFATVPLAPPTPKNE